MAARSIVSGEEAVELRRLYQQHAAASAGALAALAKYGMESPEFLDADRATGVIWRRIREILGVAGTDWRA
jgi:hypothetical protein